MSKILKTFNVLVTMGTFEVLFEQESAIDFPKYYSIFRWFPVDCFYSSIIRNLRNFQQNWFFGKTLDFRLL